MSSWRDKQSDPVVVVAEIGVNHNGDIELAHRLCDEAKKANADAVKFQTFHADVLVKAETPRAPYQLRAGKSSQYEMLEELELSDSAFREIFSHCEDIGIDCFSTPYDEQAVNFLADVGVLKLKIASADIVNRPLLEAARETGLPVVQSTGMATMTEVARAVELFDAVGAGSLTLLHCVTAYPLEASQVNLQWMDALRAAFGLPVGYSDHTTGISVPVAAVARGATMIEKHFTLSKTLNGPDHAASLEPDGFAAMVNGIRETEQSIGTLPFGRTESDLANISHMRRSLHARSALKVGAVIGSDDVVALRPDEGIDPWLKDLVVGREVKSELAAGDPITWLVI